MLKQEIVYLKKFMKLLDFGRKIAVIRNYVLLINLNYILASRANIKMLNSNANVREETVRELIVRFPNRFKNFSKRTLQKET